MSSFIPQVTYKIKNFIIPNSIFLLTVFLIFGFTFYLFFKTKKRGNLLYEFSIVSLMMLLLPHHVNPHYYIFTLFAFISILKMYSYEFKSYRFSFRLQFFIVFIYIFLLLSTGNLIPFRAYEKAIEELTCLLSEGEALRERCVKAAKKHLSLEMGVDKYLGIYERLIGEK